MTTRRTRREFLATLAGAAVATGLVACASGDGVGLAAPGAPFADPDEHRSRDGRLEIVLVAAARSVRFGDRHRLALTYNGTSPGPTLRVRPGDTLVVTLENRLDAPTNLHTHGLHVSPEGAADNVFVRVDPGGRHRYEYRIPDDHPGGTFWYHPHHHGLTAEQLFGGMAGAIVVEDPDAPALASGPVRERVMVIADPPITDTTDGFGVPMMDRMRGREGDVVLVNGIRVPRLRTTTGTAEHWRIVNASSSRPYRLSLEGTPLRVVATDGGRLARPVEVSELLLVPGQRIELLVTSTRAGSRALRALPYDRGRAMGMGGGSTEHGTTELLRLDVRADGPTPTVTRDLGGDGVPGTPVVRHRTLTLAMGMGGGGGMGGGMGGGGMGRGMGDGMFTIDGRSFDPARTDLRATLGTTEEWVLRNTSPMDHPFHLHVWPFAVLDGPDADLGGRRDTVNVPANDEVRIRVAFADIAGRTVYHCHILDHEDLGMMGVIDVSDG